MSNITPPIFPPDPSEWDKIVVNPIGKDRMSGGAKGKPTYPSASDAAFTSKLILFVQHKLQQLLDRKKTREEKDPIKEALKSLYSLLLSLQKEDKSASKTFATELSLSWNTLKNSPTKNKGSSYLKEHIGPLKTLIHTIDIYPPKEAHSIGFYLDRSPGENWLPFPFIQILHDLHTEHLAQTESTLHTWVKEIETILHPM